MSELRIGTSGWVYDEWRGRFYPDKLPHKRELEYASGRLNSIEINGTFYSLQSPKSFTRWASETPDDFLFAIKGSKFITHQKRLKDIRIPLANFFASGLLLLGEKLGPILWQFSPWERFDLERFESFLKLLPRTAKEAAKLAKENTIKSPDRVWADLVEDKPLQYAFEPRHESFFTPEFVALLRKYNMALVFADMADKFGYAEDVTSDLIYIRLHGSTELYESGYGDEELDEWARRIRSWRKGSEPRGADKITPEKFGTGIKRDVYVYFDNSMTSRAPFDAISLSDRLGKKSKSPAK